MKVLFLVSDANCHGGTEILAYNLLHELNGIGIECELLSRWVYHGDDPDVLSLPADKAEKYCKIINSPIDKLFGHCFSDKFFKREIERIAVDGGYNWIVNHTYDLCAAIPQIAGVKTAQVFNWSIPGYEKVLSCNIAAGGGIRSILPLMAFKTLRKRWHKSLPGFSKLIMLTDTAHQEILDIDPSIPSARIVTVPDPLMQNEDSQVLSSLQNKNLVFVGRLSREKGVTRLLRIWERIVKELPDYTLSIYGTGDMKQDMETFIAEHKLPGVKLMGFCNDLAQIYTHSDLLLMTSDSEGFGMVLIEAMYYGVPCITFDCPVSPKEIIADAGIAIPCFDEQQYAKEVVRLLGAPQQMRDLQEKAIKRTQKFYINKIITMWESLLLKKQ